MRSASTRVMALAAGRVKRCGFPASATSGALISSTPRYRLSECNAFDGARLCSVYRNQRSLLGRTANVHLWVRPACLGRGQRIAGKLDFLADTGQLGVTVCPIVREASWSLVDATCVGMAPQRSNGQSACGETWGFCPRHAPSHTCLALCSAMTLSASAA